LINLGGQVNLGATVSGGTGSSSIATFPNEINVPNLNSFVYVQPGQTIPQAVALLPSTGGTVIVPPITVPRDVTLITKSNVNIIGAGMPIPNSGQTAMATSSGTILQGMLIFSGASNITVANLGIDVGDTVNQCLTDDGLVIQPTSDAIGSPMLAQINVFNVSVLGCDHAFSSSAIQHDVRIEHATGVYESNINTYSGFYGNVIKAIDANLYSIWTTGAWSNGGIIKSDDQQGISRNVHVYGYTLKNSGCFNLSTFGGTLSDVTISGLKVVTPAGTCTKGLWGQIVADGSNPGVINGVKVTDSTIDGATDDAISFQAGSTNVSLVDNTIRNETGNGIIFADTSAASNNSVDNLRLNTVSLAGVVSFGLKDFVKNVFCTAVTGSCIENSGSSARMVAENIDAGGGTLYTSFASAQLASDQIPGGITTPSIVGISGLTAPANGYITVRPGTGSPAYNFVVQNNAGSLNYFLVDGSGNWVNQTNDVVIPNTATTFQGNSGDGPVLAQSLHGSERIVQMSDGTGSTTQVPTFDSSGGLTASPLTVDSLGNLSLPSGSVSFSVLAPLTGGPNCLQIAVGGQVTQTGSPCGSGGGSLTIQTNTSNNTNQSLLNMETSSANSVGLTITPSNPSGGIEKWEITGGSYTGNSATSTLATTATNIAGGLSGKIPYNTGSGATAFTGVNATSTVEYLSQVSSGAPSWVVPPGTLVGSRIDTGITGNQGSTLNISTTVPSTTYYNVCGYFITTTGGTTGPNLSMYYTSGEDSVARHLQLGAGENSGSGNTTVSGGDCVVLYLLSGSSVGWQSGGTAGSPVYTVKLRYYTSN